MILFLSNLKEFNIFSTFKTLSHIDTKLSEIIQNNSFLNGPQKSN